MSEIFERDQFVVYGKTGVCRVVDRQKMSLGNGEGEYYVLAPQSDPKSFIYVPCDNPKLMERLRVPLTQAQIESLLSTDPDQVMPWIDDKNERSSAFRAIVSRGDRRELLRLIRCLYTKKQEKLKAGKRFSTFDETTLQECARLVEEEISVSLSIPRSAVPEYICSQLEKAE